MQQNRIRAGTREQSATRSADSAVGSSLPISLASKRAQDRKRFSAAKVRWGFCGNAEQVQRACVNQILRSTFLETAGVSICRTEKRTTPVKGPAGVTLIHRHLRADPWSAQLRKPGHVLPLELRQHSQVRIHSWTNFLTGIIGSNKLTAAKLRGGRIGQAVSTARRRATVRKNFFPHPSFCTA